MKSSILVVLLLVTEGSHAFDNKCGTGWDRFGKMCYNYVATSKTWADAEKHCLYLGGNLASVHDDLTHHFLKRLGKSSVGYHANTWIGGYDATQESTWLWSDGSVFDFSLWDGGEPNNQGPEHCIEMNFGDKDLWNDIECYYGRYFVCQKPASFWSFLHEAK